MPVWFSRVVAAVVASPRMTVPVWVIVVSLRTTSDPPMVRPPKLLAPARVSVLLPFSVPASVLTALSSNDPLSTEIVPVAVLVTAIGMSVWPVAAPVVSSSPALTRLSVPLPPTENP